MLEGSGISSFSAIIIMVLTIQGNEGKYFCG